MDFNFSWLFSPMAKLAIAGALGGLVRWLTLKQPPIDGLISIAVGAICAAYIGPAFQPVLQPIISFTGVEPDAAQGLGGFIVGIGGILVSGFFIDVWQMRRKLLKQEGQGDGQV